MNSRVRNALFIAASAAGLSSCVTLYTPPSEGPTAQLRVMQSHYPLAGVHTYDRSPCEANAKKVRIGSIGGWGGLESFNRNGMPGRKDWDPMKLIERKVPANREFIFGVEFSDSRVSASGSTVTGASTRACNLYLAFVPEENKLYEAEFVINNSRCSLPVYEITIDENGQAIRFPMKSVRKVDTSCS